MVVFSVIFGNLLHPYQVTEYLILYFHFQNSSFQLFFSVFIRCQFKSCRLSRNFYKNIFPRILIPLTPVLSLADFFNSICNSDRDDDLFQSFPTWNVVFLPLLILLMMLTSMGIGMWLSSLAIQYRDVKFAISFITSILMYTAPVVFPASLILEKSGYLLYLCTGCIRW